MLDQELKADAASLGLDYMTNDDSMQWPFDAPPVVVNHFYHEQIKRSARKDGSRHAAGNGPDRRYPVWSAGKNSCVSG